MNQIKFRALRDEISNCTFVYGQLVYRTEELSGLKYPAITEDGVNFVSCLRGTEGQYVGQTDNNGKEVYVGDFDKKGRVCQYFEKLSAFGFKHPYYAVITFVGQWVNNGEVIGNIHENTELLK